MKDVNLLALLVVVLCRVLVGMGKVEPELPPARYRLAVPARSAGHRSVGTGAQQVTVLNSPD